MPARTAEQKRLLELQRRLREAEQAVAVALLAVARALDQSPHN